MKPCNQLAPYIENSYLSAFHSYRISFLSNSSSIMSLNNITSEKIPTKDELQTSANCGDGGIGSGNEGGGGGGCQKTSVMKPPEQTLSCPRCNSSNTKFCYYNNYNLSQPRHFCKTCRRYWTKGGALRNVPIGGGCRKTKKTRSSTLRFINGDSTSNYSSLDTSGLNLFSCLTSPAMDYQLSGLSHFSSSSINPPSFMNLDPLGMSFPLIKQDSHHQMHGGVTSFPGISVASNLASSTETLSIVNQDLHWRMQQQRLAGMLGGRYGGSDGGGRGVIGQQNQSVGNSQVPKQEPVLLQNLEIPKSSVTSMVGDLERDLFFNGSYAPMNMGTSTGIPVTSGKIFENYENGSINNWNNVVQGPNQFD